MVKSANTQGLLENMGDSQELQLAVRTTLHCLMGLKHPFTEAEREQLAPTHTASLLSALEFVRCPFALCERIHRLVGALAQRITELKTLYELSTSAARGVQRSASDDATAALRRAGSEGSQRANARTSRAAEADARDEAGALTASQVQVCAELQPPSSSRHTQERRSLTESTPAPPLPPPAPELYHGESWNLAHRRWSKLYKDFYNAERGTFDISKLPDIYDNIKYDFNHNRHILGFDRALECYVCAKYMADIVIPQVSLYLFFSNYGEVHCRKS